MSNPSRETLVDAAVRRAIRDPRAPRFNLNDWPPTDRIAFWIAPYVRLDAALAEEPATEKVG